MAGIGQSLAGVHGYGNLVHRSSIRKHRKQTRHKTNSPRRFFEVGEGLHVVDRRTVVPCMRSAAREVERTRYRVGGGAQHLRRLVVKLGKGSNVSGQLRLMKNTGAANSYSGRSNPRRLWQLERLHAL